MNQIISKLSTLISKPIIYIYVLTYTRMFGRCASQTTSIPQDVGTNIGTKYLVPITWYQLLGTRYLVPDTWHQILGTKYLVTDTWYQVLGTRYLVPGSWYQVLGTKYLVPNTWYQKLGTKYLVPSAWCKVLDTRYLVHNCAQISSNVLVMNQFTVRDQANI